MRFVVAVTAGLVLGLGCFASPALAKKPAPGGSRGPEIRTLSNRADLISGGDALVQVIAPAGVTPGSINVSVDGRDVTSAFAVRSDGRYYGLIDNLRDGDNVVTATVPGGRSSLTIVGHPLGGPALAGPQIKPWTCFSGTVDSQCNR